MYYDQYLEWSAYYLPIQIKGLRVLDVGAGEGETAKFFLEHGATSVTCIEPDNSSFCILKRNSVGKPLICMHKKFEVSDLNLPFDFMKMDIEGYEEDLLGEKFSQPCIIEVHGLPLKERFEKDGYTTILGPYGRANCLCYAYKNVKR